MIASGLMPRSPVWLRKIPSTVSGSQGSRRGFAPAVRFAFPLGARSNTTLRARPCQELFSESFPGRPAGRGAPRLPGFGPSRRRVRYYTRPRRGAGGKPARTQDADNSSAVKRRRSQAEGGIGQAFCLAPHARPPGRPTQPHASSCLYIGRKIGHAFGPGVFRTAMQAAPPLSLAFPCSPPPSLSRRRGSLPKEERPPPSTPAFRAGNPLGDRPWSILSIYL